MQTKRLRLAVFLVSCMSVGPLWAQRPLAPGVLQVIPPDINLRDVHSLPMPLPGLDVQPYTPETFPTSQTLFSQTRQVVFFRDVWQLEFALLGLRQFNVDAQNPDGQVGQKNIWYLVYRVRNTGAGISHSDSQDPKFGHIDKQIDRDPTELNPVTLPGRFFGVFTLTGWVQDTRTGEYTLVEYNDQVLPQVHALIAADEDPDQVFLDTVQMAQQTLERYPADSDQGGQWGIATWYNVDPRIDFVSVRVQGLTNAFRLERNPDQSLAVRNRVLQLNFWRPGDGIDQAEDPVVFGIPLRDDSLNQIEIARRYRLPGPIIRGESVNQENLRTTVLFETDAGIDPRSFQSQVAAQLDAGQITDAVVEGFASAGITLGGDAALTTAVPGRRWTLTDTWEGSTREFVIRLHPEFWERTIEGGIRFIKRLDHVWIYE